MWPDPQETADLITFTEKILNGKLHFLCSKIRKYLYPEKENFNETLFNCVVPINLHVLQKKINNLDSKDLL